MADTLPFLIRHGDWLWIPVSLGLLMLWLAMPALRDGGAVVR